MIRGIAILVLVTSFAFGSRPVVFSQILETQVSEPGRGTVEAGEDDDLNVNGSYGEASDITGIVPSGAGHGDEELQGEKESEDWLPPGETGLGIPKGATGGGFPDRSMRTGTFGSETSIPGAGGTRAGR